MKSPRPAWILCTAMLVPLAARAENCGDTGFVAQAASDCRGSFAGSLNGAAAELAYLAAQWGGGWTYSGNSDDGGNGPFTANPQVAFSGVLGFDAPISGDFVIGLKAGTQYSYYLFRGASGLSALTFSSTEGVATTVQGNPLALSHASLYVAAVPEPGAWALLSAGLLGVGWRARGAG